MDDITLLAKSADKLLSRDDPVRKLRSALRSGRPPELDKRAWREASALGLTGLTVSTSEGGYDLGSRAAGTLMEVCGRLMTPAPFLSTIGLAVPLLNSSDAPIAKSILSDVAAGEATVAVAFPSSADLARNYCSTSVVNSNGRLVLNGHCPCVVEVQSSGWILVPAECSGKLEWIALPSSLVTERTDGVLMDGRGAARLAFEDLTVGQDNLLSTSDGSNLTEQVLTVGAALVASWLLGIADRAMEITLEHLRTRKQFGVHLGSFQALQHRMAALHCDLMIGRAVIEGALEAIDSQDPRSPLLASAAKLRLGQTALKVASEGIQMHGAMGMTEEADIGFFYKAARVGDLLAGHHLFHKARATRLLGLAP